MGSNLPGLVPQSQGRDWNAASGWEYGSQAPQREQVERYALEQMMLDAQQKQLANQRYQQSTPHEVEGLSLRNKETIARTPGVQAQSDILGTQSRIARGTEQGVMDATNLNNVVSGLEHSLRAIELQAGVSPMYADADYQKLRMNMPRRLQDIMPTHYEPGLADKARNLVLNNPAHNRNMAEQNTKGQYGLDEQRLRNEGALNVANVQSQRAQAVAALKTQQQKVETKLAEIIGRILEGKATDLDRRMYIDLQTILMQLRAAGQSNLIDPNALNGRLLGIPQDPRGVPSPVPPPGGNGITPPLDPLGIRK